MAITSVAAPVGGIVAEIDGAQRPLVLRNGEIERFEEHHAPVGIFEMLDRLYNRGDQPQARHVRDLVALGLMGGGMTETAVDALMKSQGPDQNVALRSIATGLVTAAFLPPKDDKTPKKRNGVGGRRTAPKKSAAGTSKGASATSSKPA
ncbi:hypothetical protein GCM10011534_12230 [Pseudooceanicola nanhaiensis]|jgi:hypothetical protein|uniref:Gene transfer agent family protein n=1 Tax=Pseudooceanicola nanhaiensis TaxID=375761 RepID=A0A917SQC7_9RHOB|nr:GTA-gp10 family protein [Pseudooceanicola nanhaiensis]GGL91611.1 hypothetical protein GCM10011534_12230 [Pseudooceanicola nanhaiensis]